MAATNNNPSQQTRTGPHDTWQARNPSLTLMRSTPIHQHSTPTDHSNQTEEHHITSFDAGSFFNLHDYDSSNTWTAEDLLKTYGLKDDSTRHIPQAEKDKAVAEVIKIFDRDLSGTISFAEYTVGAAQGLKLPDFGFGPGHHGDDEYEYEIHHFEKYVNLFREYNRMNGSG